MTPGYDERPRLQYNEMRTTIETDCTFSYDTPRGRVVGEVGAASNGAFIAVCVLDRRVVTLRPLTHGATCWCWGEVIPTQGAA